MEKKRMSETSTDLSGDAVVEISGELRKLLADVFALYVKTKNFHWHISGRWCRSIGGKVIGISHRRASS